MPPRQLGCHWKDRSETISGWYDGSLDSTQGRIGSDICGDLQLFHLSRALPPCRVIKGSDWGEF